MLNTTKIILQQHIKGLQTNLAKNVSTTSNLYSNYLSSRPLKNIEEYPEVEISKNPPEWKYVERLLPPTTIPKPKIKESYPSGWRPQKSLNENYFIARTANHMMPVYLKKTFRGQRRITVVRRIDGDIWELEKNLREIIQKDQNGKVCATQVNEMSGQIHIHGDFVNLIKHYLMKKGH